MTDTLRAIILGIVEGLTEFLPISSTGHMILTEPLLGIREQDPFWSGAFDIFIQIGAIGAVVVYFWRRLYRLSLGGNRRTLVEAGASGPADPPAQVVLDDASAAAGVPWHEHILVKLFVAFLPAAVIGKLAGDFVEARLKTPTVVAAALIVGGLAILIIERARRRIIHPDAGAVPLRVAFCIGLAQCLALVPGTSRSAATILGALLLGLSPAAAAEFSFFLAIPTLLAAGGYALFKHRHELQADQVALLGLGFSVAFVVALAVVAAFMRYIQTRRFTPFAVYRIVLGAVVLAALGKGWL
ncbi:MAG: undecaprenyl-diphosphatase 1 [Phycisphaerae bacterium]